MPHLAGAGQFLLEATERDQLVTAGIVPVTDMSPSRFGHRRRACGRRDESASHFNRIIRTP
jgi:hypothetical protein